MNGALTFQKWFGRLVILFVIWNCVGLRYTVYSESLSAQTDDLQKHSSLRLFLKEKPSLKLIYTELK